jgi:uncharacterized protein YqiB (DUF1249 family)
MSEAFSIGPASTILLEIKKTWRLIRESIHVEVITCNGAEAVLDVWPLANTPLHSRDACYA